MTLAVNLMSEIALAGLRVLIREDLNVPVKNGVITSDARIRAALPTIEAAVAANAQVLLMSHLGRPTEGKFEEQFSLRPVADYLAEHLGRPVELISDWRTGGDIAGG